MRKLAGKSLDPDLVHLMEQSLGLYPIGTMVRLSTMEIGIVTGNAPGGVGMPKIAILYDRAGNPLPTPQPADLSDGGADGKARRVILGTVNPILHPSLSLEGVLATAMS
jgi:hypothetical protein